MRVTLGALTRLYENWHGFDDFCVFFQVDIGFAGPASGIETFSFAVVSPKRLGRIASDKNIELGQGVI